MRTFYLIVATQTFSIIGSRLSGLAVGFYIFAQTGQATPLLLISLFSMLPSIFAANIGGVLADRWDRRKLMLVADLGQAACTLLLLFSFATGSFQLWHLYALVFVSQLLGSIQHPAFAASITMLVPDDKRDRANALTQLSSPAAGIIAPIIAGLLYGSIGVIGTIAIDLFTFIAAAGVFLVVSIPAPTETEHGRRANASVWASFTGGLAFLRERRPMLVLTMQFGLVNFCIAGSMGMAMAYMLGRTSSEATAGLLIGISSAGGLIGGIVMGIWGGTRPRIHTIMPAIILSGICLALFGLSQSPVALGAAIFGLMFPLAFVNAPVMSIMQAKTPPDLQGRVFAVLGQISLVLTPIAYLLYGFLADQVLEPAVGTAAWEPFAGLFGSGQGSGMAVIIFTAGVLMAVSSALVYALPSIRHMEANLPDYKALAAPPHTQPVADDPELALEPVAAVE
ncbi:MAG: MFS transporter [Chloroflexi bacterium]|nr:MFS transporter [Chloroflexota bacterium]